MTKRGAGREGTNFFEDNIDSDYNKEGGGGGGGISLIIVSTMITTIMQRSGERGAKPET